MNVSTLDIQGLLYFEPTRFEDGRGFLYERYNPSTLSKLGVQFIQQNVSVLNQGVIRGMHWQYPPHAQGKLVTCLYGDGADIRALTYVEDLQRVLNWFMEEVSLQSHIIVSSCQEVTIRELASQISQIMGFGRNVIFNGEGNLGQRKVAVSKVLNELLPNFEFTLLREGLISTVEWFKQESGRPSSVGRASLS